MNGVNIFAHIPVACAGFSIPSNYRKCYYNYDKKVTTISIFFLVKKKLYKWFDEIKYKKMFIKI